MVASLSPVGPAEFALAERAAHLLWRLRRAAQLDAAACAVALRPAAPFAAPPPSDPCDLPPGVRGDGELTRRHADGVCARRAADAAARGADLLRRPDGAPDADPVAADVTAEVWRAACRACGRVLPTDARDLARRFRPAPDGADEVDFGLDRQYRGWSAGTVREGLAFLAAETSTPGEEVTARTAGELDQAVGWWRGKAEAAEREVARGAATTATVRAAAAMAEDGPGPRHLELAAKYERHLTGELARTLRLLEGLRASRRGRPGGR